MEHIELLKAGFEKADSDLRYVLLKLEESFAAKDRNSKVNPVELLHRINKIQEELPIIREDCIQIVAAKQELLDVCKMSLVSNRNDLVRLQKRVNINVPNEDPIFRNFNEVIDLWDQENHSVHNTMPVMTSEELTRNILRENHALESYEFRDPMDSNKNSEPENQTLGPADNQVTKAPAAKSPGKKVVRKPSQLILITKEEFLSVSSLVRGRSTLEAVNQVYEAMFKYYKSRREKGIHKMDYLSLQQITNLGCKITGQTGEAKLSVLRNLGAIEVNKQGVRLFQTKAKQ